MHEILKSSSTGIPGKYEFPAGISRAQNTTGIPGIRDPGIKPYTCVIHLTKYLFFFSDLRAIPPRVC